MMKKLSTLLLLLLFILVVPLQLQAATVKLNWQPNAEPDLSGYNLYYGTQPRDYGLPVPVSNGTTCTIENLNSEEVYYFAVTAVDNNGNESGFSNEVSKNVSGGAEPVDTAAPVVTITAPANSSNYTTDSGRMTIAGTAADANPIQQVIVNVPSLGITRIANGTDNWSLSGTLPYEGLYEMIVTAEDAYGNIGQDTITVNYTTVDAVAPVVTISTPTSSESLTTNTSQIDLAGSASDDHSLQQITWNSNTGGSGVASGTENWSISGIILAVGSNIITVTATDGSGNRTTDQLAVTRETIDTTAPVVTITAPTSADVFTSESSQISLFGTASDDRDLQQITWSSSTGNSGTASGTDNWSISGINLAKGVQVITVTATDGAGNRSSDTLTVTYEAADTTAPTVAITSPTTKTYYFSRTDTVAIGGRASDDVGLAKVTWRNSRGESGICSGIDNWQASGIKLNRWWNTITVTAIDLAGNTDEYSLKVFRW